MASLTTAEAESLNSVNSKDQRIATPNQIITAGQTTVWIHLSLCQEKKKIWKLSLYNILLVTNVAQHSRSLLKEFTFPTNSRWQSPWHQSRKQELIATVGSFTKCSKATKTTTACKREQSTLHYLVLESETKACCHLQFYKLIWNHWKPAVKPTILQCEHFTLPC